MQSAFVALHVTTIKKFLFSSDSLDLIQTSGAKFFYWVSFCVVSVSFQNHYHSVLKFTNKLQHYCFYCEYLLWFYNTQSWQFNLHDNTSWTKEQFLKSIKSISSKERNVWACSGCCTGFTLLVIVFCSWWNLHIFTNMFTSIWFTSV